MNKPNKVDIERGKKGECNICLENKKLTWEHIVPQVALFYDDLILKTVHQHVHGDKIDYRPRISQNGLKLKTVCADCNSRIGREFDPALIDFLKTVKNFGESSLVYNSVTSIKCKPNAIIRAVLGHLLAAKYHLEYSQFDETVRNLLFDYSKPIPDNINVFYWAYPYKNIAAYRDAIMLSKRGSFDSVSVFQILKCYPVSFLVTDVKEYENLFPLWTYNSMKPTETTSVPINLFQEKPPNWPEAVGADNIFGLGQAAASSITSIQRKDQNT